MFALVVCVLLVLIFAGGVYFAHVLLFEDNDANRKMPNRVIIHDDLSQAILALINDTYSPFYEANLHDHLVTDLDIDSLDLVDLLFDVSQIADTELNAAALHKMYGRNPTIAQLIAYTRYAMASAK